MKIEMQAAKACMHACEAAAWLLFEPCTGTCLLKQSKTHLSKHMNHCSCTDNTPSLPAQLMDFWKVCVEDPELHHGLAREFSSSGCMDTCLRSCIRRFQKRRICIECASSLPWHRQTDQGQANHRDDVRKLQNQGSIGHGRHS